MAAICPCPECDDMVVLGPTGWGRCRSCGHETVRDSQPYERDEENYVRAAVGGAGLASLFDK